MGRIVQVGDVFRGTVSGRIMKVTKVTDAHATMKWECHEWVRGLTPEGTLVEADLYTFIAGPPVPEIRKGDRVRAQGVVARKGLVTRTLDDGWIAVDWEDGMQTVIRRSDVRLAPLTVQPEKPAADDLMPGDRVRLKYNNKTGTVVRKTGTPWSGEDPAAVYLIQWDHRPHPLPEPREGLVVLHAPRATDAPLPAQKAIDEVDALREELKAKVESLQGQIRELNKTKKKLTAIEF